MNATFAFDHRVIDGALGGQLATAFRHMSKTPWRCWSRRSKVIRPATKLDASELVCLIDCAGYGIPLGVWAGMLDDEASVLEVGRKRAMREEGGFSYRNAWIAERDGAVAGALVGYRLDEEIDLSDIDDVPASFRPLWNSRRKRREAGMSTYWPCMVNGAAKVLAGLCLTRRTDRCNDRCADHEHNIRK